MPTSNSQTETASFVGSDQKVRFFKFWGNALTFSVLLYFFPGSFRIRKILGFRCRPKKDADSIWSIWGGHLMSLMIVRQWPFFRIRKRAFQRRVRRWGFTALFSSSSVAWSLVIDWNHFLRNYISLNKNIPGEVQIWGRGRIFFQYHHNKHQGEGNHKETKGICFVILFFRCASQDPEWCFAFFK